jgi:antitoxin (DNA-binding transcriptional repressor) of toxin-antitoxin stability system
MSVTGSPRHTLQQYLYKTYRCYGGRNMKPEAGPRELRNNTADRLRRVEHGEEIVTTTRVRHVAAFVPIATDRRRWLPHVELARRLAMARANPGLRADLARIAGDTTDDLRPIVG